MAENNVVELRQYTLRGGQRDTLIAMFEKSFLDPLNAVGNHIIGTFRDLDDPDRFVWIRGFRNLAGRPQALAAFYDGPVWMASRAAANATMVDSDNVLLLRPAGSGRGFAPQTSVAGAASSSMIGATIYYLGDVDSAQFVEFFDRAVLPHVLAAGVRPLACFVSEQEPNNYKRLPVREHERTFVWFAQWTNAAAEQAFAKRLAELSGWRDSAPDFVLRALMRKPERLRLAPTLRSALR